MSEERLGASFGIDITSLRAGLNEANRLIRQSESEFRSAAAGMDDWRNSEEGLTKRQQTLNTQIDLQKTKIKALTDEKNRLIAKMREEGKSQEEIDKAIDKTNKQIEKEGKQLDRLQSELNRTESSLDDMGKATEDVTKSSEKAGEGFTVMKGALASLVADGFRKAIDAAKDFSKEMITTAAEIKAANSQFTQTFGELEGDASEAIDAIASKTGILATRLRTTGAGIYAFARSSGATTSEAMELMQTALEATADSAAYYDKSLEDSAETLQSFLKGNFANDAALGVSATEFTRNAKAAELFGKKYNDLSEIEKQKTLLKMVTDSQKLSGAMGQAARESDGFENVMGNVTETWKQFQAKVGTPVLESLIPVIQEVTKGFQGWTDSVDWNKFGKIVTEKIKAIIKEGKTLGKSVLPVMKSALKVVGSTLKFVAENFELLSVGVLTAVTAFKAFKAVMAVTTAITAAQTAVAGLTAGVGLATKAQVVWNAAMSANPIGAVITAVALLAGGIALLVGKQKEAKQSTEFLNESQRETVKAANEAAEAYRETKEAADELAGAQSANVDYVKNNLLPQLQNIIDSNGRVKAGDEARAEFILGELNNALGTEYDSLNQIVDANGKVKDSVYEVIEAKKAQLMLEAYENSYREAIQKVADAEKGRATQSQALAGAESELLAVQKEMKDNESQMQELVEEGRLQEANYLANQHRLLIVAQNEKQQAYDEQLAKYNELDTAVEGYYNTIDLYENASNEIIKGNTESAIGYLGRLGGGFKTAASTAQLSAEEQKRTLEQQVIDTEVNLRIMEADYAKASKNMTDEERKQAQARIENARQQADDAKAEFKKVGGNITKGIADGAESEEWTLSGAMSRLINRAVSAAQRAMDAHSPSRRFKKEVGRLAGLGVAVGVDDSTKDVVKSVKNQVEAMSKAYDLGNISSSVNVGMNARATTNKSNPETVAGSVIVNQTNNYSQAHSRYEIYKSKQQTEAAVRLAMGV